MSNIKKELERDKKLENARFEGLKEVQEMKLLGNGEEQEFFRIARQLGNNSLTRAENEKGEKIEISELDKEYGGNVFTEEQIRKIAKKYDLRLGKAKRYLGNMEKSVIDSLIRFNKEVGKEISEAALEHNFYILAPVEAFEKVTNKQYNPAIFYFIKADKFKLIHNWGPKFGLKQRFKGLRHASRLSMFLIDSALILLTVTGIISIFTDPISHFLWLAAAPIGLNAILIWASVNDRGEKIYSNNLYHKGRWRKN